MPSYYGRARVLGKGFTPGLVGPGGGRVDGYFDRIAAMSLTREGRQRVSTGSPFEPKVGISRAVRSGRIIAVTGTAPLGPDGKTVAKGDAAAQARRCLEIIQKAIEDLGGKLPDVTRTRILLTRIEDWEQVALVHGGFFGEIRPANTIMQVVRFIDPDWLVEIEADAVVED
jgi:enamine deaminase RidA (YjgF/YER057c/UK114 family)